MKSITKFFAVALCLSAAFQASAWEINDVKGHRIMAVGDAVLPGWSSACDETIAELNQIGDSYVYEGQMLILRNKTLKFKFSYTKESNEVMDNWTYCLYARNAETPIVLNETLELTHDSTDDRKFSTAGIDTDVYNVTITLNDDLNLCSVKFEKASEIYLIGTAMGGDDLSHTVAISRVGNMKFQGCVNIPNDVDGAANFYLVCSDKNKGSKLMAPTGSGWYNLNCHYSDKWIAQLEYNNNKNVFYNEEPGDTYVTVTLGDAPRINLAPAPDHVNIMGDASPIGWNFDNILIKDGATFSYGGHIGSGEIKFVYNESDWGNNHHHIHPADGAATAMTGTTSFKYNHTSDAEDTKWQATEGDYILTLNVIERTLEVKNYEAPTGLTMYASYDGKIYRNSLKKNAATRSGEDTYSWTGDLMGGSTLYFADDSGTEYHPTTDGESITSAANFSNQSNGNSWSVPADGNYTVTLTPLLLTAAAENNGVTSTGVEEISTAICDTPEYFNLQGAKVQNPSKGIYIVRLNGKTSKVVIR